jgi:ATPase subunit of ABC transporter with duplicated ATPase domains
MSSPLARLDRVTFSFANSADGPALFTDFSLDLHRGVLAITGENGAGKSTLLDLLDGTLTPERGRVVRAAPLIARTRQDVDAAPPATLDENASRLGCDVDVLTRWSTASPGERRRWQLAHAFALQAGVLLLDEPTNHLDDDARDVVIELVRRAARTSAVAIVTHDRAVVDALASRTLLLHRGKALLVDGGWDEAWSAHTRDQHALRDAQQAKRNAALAARHALGEARRRAGDADKQRSARTRMKGPRDHDATGLLANFRSESAAARYGRDVGRVRSELARAETEWHEAPRADRTFGAELHIDAVPLRRPWLAVVDVPGQPTLSVARDARLHVTGANGAGKTSLLKRIVAAARLDDDALFFLPQDLTPHEERAALAAFHALPREERGRAGELLAALGLDPSRLASSARPSCGEAKKLLLARALAVRAHALVLDEPTNHLDLPSVERLARALAHYGGALVVVSHDDGFATSSRLETRVALTGLSTGLPGRSEKC